MAGLHGSVLIAGPAGTDRLDPVGEMVAAGCARRALFLLLAEEDLVAVVVLDHHVSFGTVEDVADTRAVLGVGGPGTHLELDHLALGIDVSGGQDFGSLLVVVEKELTAHGRNLSGQSIYPESPHTHVGLVDAL